MNQSPAMPSVVNAYKVLISTGVILGSLVLLAGCESKKPDLAIYDVQFSLVQATDPLSDIMWDSLWKSRGIPETEIKEFTEKLRRNREADPDQWAYWVTFYITNRGDKDAFWITVKLTTPPNTTKTPPPFIPENDSERSHNWDEFYAMDEYTLDHLKSGEVKHINYPMCFGKFRQKPSPEILDKLKGTRIEIGSFESEP